jgi:hypothetical protein
VVLAAEPSPARAIKSVAPILPIVCVTLSDALIPELAASYARPGGSVTGIAMSVEGMTGKLVELTLYQRSQILTHHVLPHAGIHALKCESNQRCA